MVFHHTHRPGPAGRPAYGCLWGPVGPFSSLEHVGPLLRASPLPRTLATSSSPHLPSHPIRRDSGVTASTPKPPSHQSPCLFSGAHASAAMGARRSSYLLALFTASQWLTNAWHMLDTQFKNQPEFLQKNYLLLLYSLPLHPEP